MRRNNSLWKTTVVSLSAMMTVSMGAAVWAASTEKTTQESQSDQVTEENSETKADTKDTENQTSEPQSAEDVSDSSENQTEECKITLSDDGILVDGEAISTDSESAVYVGADIVYYKEGQDALTEQAMKMMVIQRKRQPSIPSLQSQRLEPTE